MAKKKETLFKEKVFKWFKELQDQGVRLWYVKVQQVAIGGTPDILMCLYGYFYAIELKKGMSDDSDPRQTHELRKIRLAQGHGLVLCPETFPRFQAEISNRIEMYRQMQGE